MAKKVSGKTYDSVRKLADRLELSHTAVNGYVKRNDWPFNRKGPWRESQVPEIQRWAADTLEKRAGPDEESGDETKKLRKDKLREEVRKLRANADQAETALQRERGTLMEAAAVEREWAGVGVLVRNGFQNLAGQLVPLALTHGMPNEAAAAFGQQIDEAVAGILRHLSRDGIEDAD